MKYKFKLIESALTKEEKEAILEDVQEMHDEEQATLEEVREILTTEGFEESTKLNGVAFTKTLEEKDYSIKAQFYVDTTTFDYSTYISTENNKGDTNFSSKGKYENIVPAAKRFVFEVSGI
jgi:hypothetical protein